MHFPRLYRIPPAIVYFLFLSLWWNRREFIHPVEVSAFYRSTFQIHDLKNTIHKVPTHIYCRIGKVLESFLLPFHEVLGLYNSLHIFPLACAVGGLADRAVVGYALFCVWKTGVCRSIFCENLRYSCQLLQGYRFLDFCPMLL